MRCALQYVSDKPLNEQSINAWGEMQSLKETPCYREEDIKDEKEQEYFKGYKMAVDDFCTILDNQVFDEVITEEQSDEIQKFLPGELAMLLFSILDNQASEEE